MDDGTGPPVSRSDRRRADTAVSRRFFLRRAAVAAGSLVVVGGAALGLDEALAGGGSRPRVARSTTTTTRPVTATTTTTEPATVMAESADGVMLPTSPAVMAENARPGTPWWIPTAQTPRSIEGFAGQVSAVAGDEVTLYVNTGAASFHVEAYRMGYYQGIGGRLIWTSPEVVGTVQPPPVLDPGLHTVECHWTPSTTLPVTADWVPGSYLLKLVGVGGEEQYVPLCVRDDASTAALVVQHSVTTWQAYNLWGGYSLYYGRADGGLSYDQSPGGGSFEHRARVVSFDRPYSWAWASGAADYIGNELPVVYDVERLGLDVTYWTDVDLHARPDLLLRHRGLLSLGHDEYWSAPMRQGAAAAVTAGVNLGFLGANACYRQIRFEDSPVGPNRHQVCYKSAAEDPLAASQPALTTVNWPDPPVDQPECTLIGATYQDIGAEADLVVTDPGHWVLAGVGLTAGQRLPKVVQGEFDRYVPGQAGSDTVDVVAHSPVANRGGNSSDMTWWTQPGGGGVFATGNATWIGGMVNTTGFPTDIVPAAVPGVTAHLLRIMENVYSVLGGGPGSASHPSQGTWRAAYGGKPLPAAPNPAGTT